MQGKQAKIVSPTQERAILGYLDTTRYPTRDRVMFLLSMKAGLRAKEMARVLHRCGFPPLWRMCRRRTRREHTSSMELSLGESVQHGSTLVKHLRRQCLTVLTQQPTRRAICSFRQVGC